MQFESDATACTVTVVEFCNCESLAFQQGSTSKKFLVLNLKEFQEVRRVDHLVPNQDQMPIELY